MEQHKTPQKDIYRHQPIFFQVGLILSLVIVMTAFEWRFYDDFEQIDLGMEDTPTFILEAPTIIEESKQMPKPMAQDPEIIASKEENIKIEEVKEKLALTDASQDKKSTDLQSKKPVFDIPKVHLSPKDEEDTLFIVVEQQPEPEGGMKAFYKYLSKNIKYPRLARRQGIEGKVFVQFVVSKDGTFTDFKILKGIGAGCDEEALRVLKNAPAWKPGKQRGRPVRVQMSIPISFTLN